MGVQPPTPPRPPLIPESIADAPTQRLYLCSAFLLLQSYKVSQLFSTPSSPTTSPLLDINTQLWKWILIDLIFVWSLTWLRIPRLSWGWVGLLFLRIALVALDYTLFGRWKFATSFLIPGFIKGLMETQLSVGERKVRVPPMDEAARLRLSGEFTIHILASDVPTAVLNPHSNPFCLATSSPTSPSQVMVPLILNNTQPTWVHYNITSFSDPPTTQAYAIPASDLLQPESHHLHLISRSQASDPNFDYDAWENPQLALAHHPHNPKNSNGLRHVIPSSSSSPSFSSSSSSSSHSSHTDSTNSYQLSSTQKLYHVPISHVGLVKLTAVETSEGGIAQLKSRAGASGVTRVVACPRIGLRGDPKVTKCASLSQQWQQNIGLEAMGEEPLSIKWRVEGTGHQQPSVKTLSGVVRTSEEAATIIIPEFVTLDQVGQQTITLESVTDKYNNKLTLSHNASTILLPGTIATRSFAVNRPPSIKFVGDCASTTGATLYSGRVTTLKAELSGALNPRSSVVVLEGPEGRKEYDVAGKAVALVVAAAGAYTISEVKGQQCPVVIESPSSCVVKAYNPPTLHADFEPIDAGCGTANVNGTIAHLNFSGSPPFTLSYSYKDLDKPNSKRTQKVLRSTSSRSEIRFESGPGNWEYSLDSLGDQHYKDGDVIKLASGKADEFMLRQKVQPVSEVKWLSVEKESISSCDGNEILLEVQLKGNPPYEIAYSVDDGEPLTISNIKTAKHSFKAQLPPRLLDSDGDFTVSLRSLLDGTSCRRSLALADKVFEVQRTIPTAFFYVEEGAVGKSLIKDSDKVRIPLRLTGRSPWTIGYLPPPTSSNKRPEVVTVKKTGPNDPIVIPKPVAGRYTLVSVTESGGCPGNVTDLHTWDVSILPRPSVRLSSKFGLTERKKSLVRRGVCVGAEDHASVDLEGEPGFNVSYRIFNGSTLIDTQTFVGAVKHASFPLFTESPGNFLYQITGVSDQVYTQLQSRGVAAVSSFEQRVYSPPSATFVHGAKASFCANSVLNSRGESDLILHFDGQAPFEVTLEMMSLGGRYGAPIVVPNIQTNEWAVKTDVALDPQRPIDRLIVTKVIDAHGCLPPEPNLEPIASTAISLTQAASITPTSPQTDFCVGDFLEFDVQGSPPFKVTYEFAGKKFDVSLPTSKLRRLADAPGEFKILSVAGAGRQDGCQSKYEGSSYRKVVHDKPKAMISHGGSTVVDLKEGEQEQIVFNLSGEPPFTFTYSRKAPQDRSKDKTDLEVETVSGHMDHTYTISTSKEGTWTVTSIADKHCSVRRPVSLDRLLTY